MTAIDLVEIFNKSQHPGSSDAALQEIKRLYKSKRFQEDLFKKCVKKLLQSQHNMYFKTSCEFLTKFLQFVTQQSDEAGKRKVTKAKPKQAKKRRSDPEDELLFGYSKIEESVEDVSEIHAINSHDYLISGITDIALRYMQSLNDLCRLNSVYLIFKLLTNVESLDEEICLALKNQLPKRIRDRKPIIRAHAVAASKIFQDHKLIKEGFLHHFYRDPELVVRKALLQVMSTEVFGFDFIVESTQDVHEQMKKSAYQRLGKLSPLQLSIDQRHKVIHNGMNERDRQTNYVFKSQTLEPWLNELYKDRDIYKLLQHFDVVEYSDDTRDFLELIYAKEMENIDLQSSTTSLHSIVESFKSEWLNSKNLPDIEKFNENVVTIWISLVKFCRRNSFMIKPVQIETRGESFEEVADNELLDLHERITPDLINIVDFVKILVDSYNDKLKSSSIDPAKMEFIYQNLMDFLLTYEIGDELERKTVQEVLSSILNDSLLTGKFKNFIVPVVKCLAKLIYNESSNLMISYISELINNVRSQLEDVANTTSCFSPISRVKSNKDQEAMEYKIATLRVDIEDTKDELERCIRDKDFDRAKIINDKLSEMKSKLTLLHDRRCSAVFETPSQEPDKLSSTMVEECNFSVFKHNPNELMKCFQMYIGCLQNIKLNQIPETMMTHMMHLISEGTQDWFKENSRIRSLVMTSIALSALVSKTYALENTTLSLLISGCTDEVIEVRTIAFEGLVDVICQHDLDIDETRIYKFLVGALRDYGKYDPKTMKKNQFDYLLAMTEGTTKLFYHAKLSSPELLAHIILSWYHPRTHPKIKQYIGIFLPIFVQDALNNHKKDDTWLSDLLENTYIMCIEFLHAYILGPGFNIMASDDMNCIISFLTKWVPIVCHRNISQMLDERIKDLTGCSPDLCRYLKLAKTNLKCDIPIE